MGDLAERLDGIQVRVSAPGADIEAELRGRSELRLTFGESVYEFSDERALERTLASLARLLYTGWARQYQEAIAETNLTSGPRDQHDLNYQEEVREIEASGESGDGRVALSTVGMGDFAAQIKRGTVRELEEDEFAAQVGEAATLLLGSYQAQVNELKLRYYG